MKMARVSEDFYCIIGMFVCAIIMRVKSKCFGVPVDQTVQKLDSNMSQKYYILNIFYKFTQSVSLVFYIDILNMLNILFLGLC